METIPTVFLSSTFYDLRQVRFDVAAFIERQLGYRFLASEHATFPVDPAVDTIENCRRSVENDADVFVLLIGNRYGSVPSGEQHSVTNLEYSTARAKGIPIFAFILRELLAVLPVWKANPAGDFSSIADTSRLFDFVDQVRAADRVWTFPFDTAEDVIGALRTQLAYEMSRGLACSRATRQSPVDLTGVSGQALRIALDKPRGWQALFVAATIEQEMAAIDDVVRDYRYGVVRGGGERVKFSEISDWISANTAESARLVSQLSDKVFDLLNRATSSSDIPGMRYGARAITTTYRAALEWAIRIRSTHVPEDWQPLSRTLSDYMGSSLATIESLPEQLRSEVARHAQTTGDVRSEIKLTFDVDEEVQTRFHEQLLALEKKYGV